MSLSLERMRALLLQEYYITKHSLEVIMDVFFMSILTTVLFGFFSRFLSSSIAGVGRHYLLLGIILWEVVRVAQYSMSVGALWNVWSHNLSNMFVSPLSVTEYILTHMLSAAIKSLIVAGIAALAAGLFFDLNILDLGLMNLFLFFTNLLVFAWSSGIAILGLIFRYGTRIQALAWGAIVLFQPLTAAFFPVATLPSVLKEFSQLFPPTYVFESARHALAQPGIVEWHSAIIAASMNIVYGVLSLWLFHVFFEHSKDSGQFAKNEM